MAQITLGDLPLCILHKCNVLVAEVIKILSPLYNAFHPEISKRFTKAGKLPHFTDSKWTDTRVLPRKGKQSVMQNRAGYIQKFFWPGSREHIRSSALGNRANNLI